LERWLEHLGLNAFWTRWRNLQVPDYALTWTRLWGSLNLAFVVLLFLSGFGLTFYYSPVPGVAYDSVDYAQFNLPFGEVIRGVHHYAGNLLLLTMILHLGRAFLVGAYKAPRELVWVSGVLIMSVVPVFIISGDLLPWNQQGYWSTQVRKSILTTVPFFGGLLVRILEGSSMTGIVALTRFYVLHVIILPPLLVVMIAVHLHFLRIRGLSEPLRGDTISIRRVPFWPTIVNRWLLLFLLAAVILGWVAWQWPVSLGDPADPTDTTYVPRPEWWVLPLNQLVTIFRGPLLIFATVIIPAALLALLLALPLVDRSPERHPARRWKTLLTGALIALILIVLGISSFYQHYLAPLP
jgi:ubiquinol-cytochrome c reductase cytochrome b subunit